MAVYGYVRVSTIAQAEEGLSLESQEKQLQGYSLMTGMHIDKMFIEKAVSGAKPFASRQEGSRLCDVLKEGDTVLVSKLDRAFRSARDALVTSDEFKKKGVNLHILDIGGDVTGNGVGKMFFTIVASFAEFERDRISERICDVKRTERDKGRFLGGSRPIGYQISEDGSLIEDAEEQMQIARIISLRKSGMSLRDIAVEVSTDLRKIGHSMVARIIRWNRTQDAA